MHAIPHNLTHPTLQQPFLPPLPPPGQSSPLPFPTHGHLPPPAHNLRSQPPSFSYSCSGTPLLSSTTRAADSRLLPNLPFCCDTVQWLLPPPCYLTSIKPCFHSCLSAISSHSNKRPSPHPLPGCLLSHHTGTLPTPTWETRTQSPPHFFNHGHHLPHYTLELPNHSPTPHLIPCFSP
ncbi:hypothetical protein FKM82_019606 [Ascaphus truei]